MTGQEHALGHVADRKGTFGRAPDRAGTFGRAPDRAGTSGYGPDRAGVIGYVPGAWDLFHIGHLTLLRRARARCDHLIAGVVLDEVVVAAKGKLPVVPFAERLEIVAHIACVDEVVADGSTDKLVMWRRLGFHVLVKGDDWKGTPKGDRLEAAMATVGVEVAYFPYTVHTSSTMLRQLISGGS